MLLQLVIDEIHVCLKIINLQNVSKSWEQLCASVYLLGGERSILIILRFAYELLQSKGKGKMQ